MSAQRSRTDVTRSRVVGAFFLLAALAGCGRELPTAQEIRHVDVATEETAVRGVMGMENVAYTIDVVPTGGCCL